MGFREVMMIYPNDLKPTELAICHVLSDGQCHEFEELHQRCISDDMATIKNLQVHVCNLRKKFLPIGMDILCVTPGRRKKGYQLIRKINNSEQSE